MWQNEIIFTTAATDAPREIRNRGEREGRGYNCTRLPSMLHVLVTATRRS